MRRFAQGRVYLALKWEYGGIIYFDNRSIQNFIKNIVVTIDITTNVCYTSVVMIKVTTIEIYKEAGHYENSGCMCKRQSWQSGC